MNAGLELLELLPLAQGMGDCSALTSLNLLANSIGYTGLVALRKAALSQLKKLNR